MVTFRSATRKTVKLRMALIGPSGSGKTYTALSVATGLGGQIAVIDTEHGTSDRYADRFRFDVCTLERDFSPARYIEAIVAARDAKYDVLIIDSLSHAWAGPGGVLELVDRAAKRAQTANTFTAWREVTPQHQKLVEEMLSYPGHLLVTMRAKTEYAIEQDGNHRTVIRKVGLAPIQREGLEYEFDIVGDMNLDNDLVISKSRFTPLAGQVIPKPGPELGEMIKKLLSGEDVPQMPPPVPRPAGGGWATWDHEEQRRFIGALSALGLSPEQMRAAFGVASRTEIDLPAQAALDLVKILWAGKERGMSPEEVYLTLGIANLREWYPRPAEEAIAILEKTA